jgi:hypothetical protein
MIDDIVLYDASGADGSTENFPARVIFTGWFDTGKQGQEWPGTFDIVPHEPPRTWKAARAAADLKTGEVLLRISLRGHRPIGKMADLTFRYSLKKGAKLTATLRNSRGKNTWNAKPLVSSTDTWTQATTRLTAAPENDSKTLHADELILTTDRGAELLVDDVLLYEPAR